MSFGLRIVHELDEILWRRFVDHHPCGTVFHLPEFYRIFSASRGHEPLLWACLDLEGRIQALFLPVLVSLLRSVRLDFFRRAVDYSGILYENTPAGLSAMQHLMHAYNALYDHRILFTEIRNLNDISSCRSIFKGCGYPYRDYLNYLVDIDLSEEALLRQIGKNTRKRIRREVNRETVAFHEISDPEEIPKAYRLLAATYRRNRIPLADISLFQNAFETLYPAQRMSVFLALIDHRIAAASFELFYKDVAYGWYQGSDARFLNYNVNEMLMWHVLKSCAQKGYKVYDFGGAGYPDEKYGVRDFKAKFGGTLVNYGRFLRVHSPFLFSVSQWGYRVIQKMPRIKSI
ncbi:MAG TPA: GNAT family N-acetyltransferase [bacterium]|nr:GNAT family N-acetyltransferase [bacterium]